MFDTAPTGHTLRFLNFPNIFEKGLNKILTLREKFSGIMSGMSGVFGSKEDMDSALEKMFSKMERLREASQKVNEQMKDNVQILICRIKQRLQLCAFPSSSPCTKPTGWSNNLPPSKSISGTLWSTRCSSPRTPAKCARLAPKCRRNTWTKFLTCTMTSISPSCPFRKRKSEAPRNLRNLAKCCLHLAKCLKYQNDCALKLKYIINHTQTPCLRPL